MLKFGKFFEILFSRLSAGGDWMRKRKRGNPQAKYQKQPPKRSSRDFQKIFVPRMLPRNLALRTSKSYNSFSLSLSCLLYLSTFLGREINVRVLSAFWTRSNNIPSCRGIFFVWWERVGYNCLFSWYAQDNGRSFSHSLPVASTASCIIQDHEKEMCRHSHVRGNTTKY